MEKLYKKIGWKNKPNLSTPLGATNLKKIDEALDGLDNRTIELNNKDAEHSRHIEGLYAETRKNAQAIESSLDALKIVPTASGSPVYIFDASNMGFEGIHTFGESKQMQTTGAQLFDINDKYDFSTSFVVDSDGWITFNYDNSAGTSTVYLNASTNKSNLLAISTNYLSVVEVESISNATIYPTSNNEGVLKGQFETAYTSMTLPTSKGVFVNIVKTRASFDDAFTMARTIISVPAGKIGTAKFRMSIIKDTTVTANTFVYEPFTNGVASPSPDFPQPIESKIVKKVIVSGNQLLDFSTLIDGIINPNTGAEQTDSTNKRTPYISCVAETVYSISNLFIAKRTCYFDTNKTFLGTEVISANATNFTTPSKCAFFTVQANKDYWSNDVMLNAGATTLPFEQFKGIQTVNLSAPIELNGIGGVRDTDKLKKFGVVVFDGSENWIGSSYLAGRYGIEIKAKATGICMCSMAINRLVETVNCCNINQHGSFYINTSFATVDEWKSHLQANPMTVVYELAEPKETALPQVDIDAIKALHSYKPNTVVMNDADAEMEVSYVSDSKLYIDRKFEALASAIVNQ